MIGRACSYSSSALSGCPVSLYTAAMLFKVVASLAETWVNEMKPGMSVLGTVVIDRRENVPLVARNTVRVEGGSYLLSVAGMGEGTSSPESIHPLARNETHYVRIDLDGSEIEARTVIRSDLAQAVSPCACSGSRNAVSVLQT